MTYYEEKGYPIYAVIEAIMTIANSNYEAWRDGHPTASFTEFEFSPKKMSSSGALFDLDKLDNISKNYLSHLTKEEVYKGVLEWSSKYDLEFNEILKKYEQYSMEIYNIEREQKKPRKDYTYYSEVKDKTWYMYDEYFKSTTIDFSEYDINEVKTILKTYIDSYYDEKDAQDVWFNRIKEMCDKLGYASDMKAYRENPTNFKGSIVDVTNIIRIAITSLSNTPNLYDIIRILGRDRVLERVNKILNNN
jgi:glutamyl-tRNA synthetase